MRTLMHRPILAVVALAAAITAQGPRADRPARITVPAGEYTVAAVVDLLALAHRRPIECPADEVQQARRQSVVVQTTVDLEANVGAEFAEALLAWCGLSVVRDPGTGRDAVAAWNVDRDARLLQSARHVAPDELLAHPNGTSLVTTTVALTKPAEDGTVGVLGLRQTQDLRPRTELVRSEHSLKITGIREDVAHVLRVALFEDRAAPFVPPLPAGFPTGPMVRLAAGSWSADSLLQAAAQELGINILYDVAELARLRSVPVELEQERTLTPTGLFAFVDRALSVHGIYLTSVVRSAGLFEVVAARGAPAELVEVRAETRSPEQVFAHPERAERVLVLSQHDQDASAAIVDALRVPVALSARFLTAQERDGMASLMIVATVDTAARILTAVREAEQGRKIAASSK